MSEDFEVKYSYNNCKILVFEKDYKAKNYYGKVVNSFKKTNLIYRMPGDGSEFYLKSEPNIRFNFYRVNNIINIEWRNPDWNKSKDIYKWKFLPFEEIFQRCSLETKKALAFHFDIFA